MVRKDSLQVGVIGVGFGQQVHVPAFRSDTRCFVGAVCASNKKRAQDIADRLKIPRAYGDWQDLIGDADIGAVSIAVPPALQADIALAALKANKAVFCEKPLALSVKEGMNLAEFASKKNLANMIDFEFPEIPHWQKAKEIVDSGRLGALRHANISWNVETYANRMAIKSWKTNLKEGGGALSTFGTHCFYYVEWLLGPITLLSAKSTHSPSYPFEADTNVSLCMILNSGIMVSIQLSTNAFLGGGHRLEVYGDEGTLVLSNPTADYINGFELFVGDRSSSKLEALILPDSGKTDLADGRIAAVSQLLRRFVDWTLEDEPSSPSFKDGLRVQNLFDAAKLSNEKGSWVDVKAL